MPAESEVTVRDVACTLCGCVCDDLTLTVRDNRIVRVQPGCPLAEPWFLALGEAAAVPARVARHAGAAGNGDSGRRGPVAAISCCR